MRCMFYICLIRNEGKTAVIEKENDVLILLTIVGHPTVFLLSYMPSTALGAMQIHVD